MNGIKPMNIFVTGGSGYLGSTLISKLINVDEVSRVFALVRKSERVDILVKRFESNKRFDFLFGDIRDYIYDLNGIDAVVHLACEHDPYICEQNSGEAIEVNVGGTLRLIEAVKKYKVPYFIYISNIGVYGKHNNVPVSEDVKPNPIGAKFLISYAGEVITRGLSDSKTKFSILRLVHMVGVGALPSKIEDIELTNKFAKQSCLGGKLTIFGDGNQTVDFVNVRDVCDCIIKLLVGSDSAWNETYNVGGGKLISINEIADIYINRSIEMGLKAPTKIYVESEHYFDDKGLSSILLDISKARDRIGWNPSIPIEDSVRELIRFHLS